MSKKSNDPEFDDYARRFTSIEQATDKLLKDTKAFTEAVSNLFTHGQGFATHFASLYHPVAGEYDLIGKHPGCEHTIKNVDGYESGLQELKSAIVPELELIDSRILAPIKELQQIMKTIRKTITKREHKLIDFDRFNNSLTKLRDKKEKTLNDEKQLFKLEQDFEVASTEYEYINTALKNELPRFLTQATQFIDPLFHSFFYMQLNIFYMLLEKLSGFAEGKFDVSITGAEIATEYEQKRNDAQAEIEALTITQRYTSTSKLMQQHRATSGSLSPGGGVALGRSVSSTSSSTSSRVPPPMRSPVPSASFKKAPPPPPSAGAAAPPPYSPPAPGASVSAPITKKAPPPPPPLKPKPKAAQYVVALYDFVAQADGDLEFSAGDRIEVVERTESSEDWWTGKIGDRQGVFPGNYVQEA
ncbi:BAR-domain-containing protein [Obba rivulosa]|uniref:BAR-domain-containing protein n=1 Tax=Obba rivulosa TaxID=1052685 RepID=A0A8E2AP75_9APHY|nr:BAR-domain-containing protein [Obba rivulosa]